MMTATRRAKPKPSAAKRASLRDKYIGSRLQLVRYGKGITQQQLSKALKISFQQVQKYETGSNRVAATRLYEIARYFDVPMTFFFEGIEQVPDTPIPAAEPRQPLREFALLLNEQVNQSDQPRVLKLLRLKDLNGPDSES
jgi:transcriptional regulator with XRE-family HTH domain